MSLLLEISAGRLAGLQEGGVLSFKGVPYARPPIGRLRWQAPQPVEPWLGVRSASDFGATAPQLPNAVDALLGAVPGRRDENCLTLNIWTPNCDGSKRAVMVWVHGGAFVAGAASHPMYDGARLAKVGDVVVVSINYRLGVLGFLNLRDVTEGRIAATGAEGLLDQIAALEWVKSNIEAFGGDPKRITVFGQSAGAMSIGALLAIPRAASLLSGAILQSGACDTGQSREQSARIAKLFLEKNEVSPQNAEVLLSASTDKLLQVQGEILALPPRVTGGLPFCPTIDEELLFSRPIVHVREGTSRNVRLLVGYCADEWKLFSAGQKELGNDRLRSMVSGVAGEAFADTILQEYREGTPGARWQAIMTDHSFGVPADRLLDAQAQFAPSFGYRFAWPSAFLSGSLGACHGIDLGYVFGTHGNKNAGGIYEAAVDTERRSRFVTECWTSFARGGAPSTDWPNFDRENSEGLMLGPTAPHRAQIFSPERRAVWRSIMNAYGQP